MGGLCEWVVLCVHAKSADILKRFWGKILIDNWCTAVMQIVVL